MPRDCAAEASLNSLLERRHAPLSYLSGPAPSPLQFAQLQASVAQRAAATSLRLVECDAHLRAVLDIVLARHALRGQHSPAHGPLLPSERHAPMLLALMATIDYLSDISPKEQAKQAGAALTDLLIASHQLGYDTAVQAGPWCMDTTLRTEMGLAAREFPAAFVHVGHRQEAALR
jgi:nitroreductase